MTRKNTGSWPSVLGPGGYFGFCLTLYNMKDRLYEGLAKSKLVKVIGLTQEYVFGKKYVNC